MYIHTCTYLYIHVHTCTYMYIPVHTCTYLYIHINTCTYLYSVIMINTVLCQLEIYINQLTFQISLSREPVGGLIIFNFFLSTSTDSVRCFSKHTFMKNVPISPFLNAHGVYIVAISICSL